MKVEKTGETFNLNSEYTLNGSTIQINGSATKTGNDVNINFNLSDAGNVSYYVNSDRVSMTVDLQKQYKEDFTDIASDMYDKIEDTLSKLG